MEPPDVYEGDLDDMLYDPSESNSEYEADTRLFDEFYDEEAAHEQWLREMSNKAKKNRKVAVDVFNVDDYMQRHGHKQMYGRKQMLRDATKGPDNYEMMWPLVHALCESLQYESHKWSFGEHRFKNIETEVEFWCHRMDSPVTETFGFGSYGTDKVFNQSQGEAILEAVKIARRSKPTDLQLKVLDKFGMLTTPEVVDERAVIHVPKMTFWQRFIFLLTARCKIN